MTGGERLRNVLRAWKAKRNATDPSLGCRDGRPIAEPPRNATNTPRAARARASDPPKIGQKPPRNPTKLPLFSPLHRPLILPPPFVPSAAPLRLRLRLASPFLHSTAPSPSRPLHPYRGGARSRGAAQPPPPVPDGRLPPPRRRCGPQPARPHHVPPACLRPRVPAPRARLVLVPPPPRGLVPGALGRPPPRREAPPRRRRLRGGGNRESTFSPRDPRARCCFRAEIIPSLAGVVVSLPPN